MKTYDDNVAAISVGYLMHSFTSEYPSSLEFSTMWETSTDAITTIADPTTEMTSGEQFNI